MGKWENIAIGLVLFAKAFENDLQKNAWKKWRKKLGLPRILDAYEKEERRSPASLNILV